ncbi:hypothetical protein [Mucilaginibacter sp.]|uniref:hypothetical protein n=1 Tax=Mucilaginibacter sp. TaxID=1882438 RepID=UPI003D0D6350
MKQAFIYSLKAWLATTAIAVISMLSVIYYALSKPNHVKEWLDPFFGLIVLGFISLLFIPAWVLFSLLLEPVSKGIVPTWKQKLLLSLVAFILIAVNSLPLIIIAYPGYQAGAIYLPFMILSIWLNKPFKANTLIIKDEASPVI